MNIEIINNKVYINMTTEETVDLIGRLAVTANNVHLGKRWNETTQAAIMTGNNDTTDMPGVIQFNISK